jgi:O-antigen/teichoic acid export membrane protein
LTSEIPIRKTGFVVFASRIISIFTGIGFLLLMTRSLSTSQFGLWEVIIDLVAFASYPAGLIGFWATREVARGAPIGKTSIALNVVLSGLGMMLYLILSFSTFKAFGSGLQPLLFGILLVPLGYLNQAVNAVVSGHRPAVLGYSLVISESCKIAVAAPLVLVYRFEVNGVILAMLASYFSQALVSMYMVRDASSAPIDFTIGKRWLAKAWLPTLMTLPYIITIADTFLASLLSRGTDLTAYYQAAFSIASIAGYSLYLGTALYPRLLRGGSDELVSTTLDLVLLFGLPMAAGAAVLAQPILALLKSQYVASSTGLVILAPAALVAGISSLFDGALLGREKADIDTAANFAKLLRSNLLFVSLVNLVMSTTYLVSIGLVIGLNPGFSRAVVVILWSSAQLVVYAVFTAINIWKLRQTTRISIRSSFVRYLVATAVMALLLGELARAIPVSAGTLGSGLRLALVGSVGFLAYFGVLYGIDPRFRGLIAGFRKNMISR